MSPCTSPTPVSGFLDPDDPTLFPRLTAAQIEQLAEVSERSPARLSPATLQWEQDESIR
jgi:hypothetical protein